ncbi:MAG: hypothetical protein WCF98_12815 [Synechococcus sp. ELA057]|jgi:hypothetical protein
MLIARLAMPRCLFPLLVLVLAASIGAPAKAQNKVPKLQSLCPMGYVDNFSGSCVSPIRYTLQPTDGRPCPSGWMNVGGGYCKKKELGIF